MTAERVRNAEIWWLFSELTRRSPALRLRGVGVDAGDPAIVHVSSPTMPLLSLDRGSEEYALVNSMRTADRAQDAIERWRLQVHASAHPIGPPQTHTLVYRVLAETLLRTMMRSTLVRVQWAPPTLIEFGLESGFLYSHHSDPEWGPFAAAREHVFGRAQQLAALNKDPLEACWVVSTDGHPVLLVDEGGWTHDPLGGHRNLAQAFGATHSVSAVYDKLIAPALTPSS